MIRAHRLTRREKIRLGQKIDDVIQIIEGYGDGPHTIAESASFLLRLRANAETWILEGIAIPREVSSAFEQLTEELLMGAPKDAA